MANNNKDGLVVLLAIALLVSPLIYIALQDGEPDEQWVEQESEE